MESNLELLQQYFDGQSLTENEKKDVNKDKQLAINETMEALSSTNLVALYYIKNYITTDQVMKKYEQYRGKYPSSNKGTPQDILDFLFLTNKQIKVQEFEIDIFENLKKIWKLLETEAAQFILLYKETDLTVLQSKIKSLSSEIDFLMRYYANVKKLDTNFHYLDMEPDERSKVDESLYKISPGATKDTNIRSQLNVVLHQNPSQSETDYVNE